jgi:S1-C subfamily serine protease
MIVGAVGWALLRPGSDSGVNKAQVGSIVDGKVNKAVNDLKAAPPNGVAVYNQVLPELVVVQAAGAGGASKDKALGSGVVINKDGQILTSLHVVAGSSAVTVTFADGTESPATIQSSEADNDTAVLSPERLPQVVVPAVLGGGVRVGDEVFAIGNPLGLVGSLTAGVVSGLDRPFPEPGGRTLQGLIQFDAAVSPGNSGGPLLNRQGQVVGIVTGLANATGTDDFVGIGFAVPIGTAARSAGAPPQ